MEPLIIIDPQKLTTDRLGAGVEFVRYSPGSLRVKEDRSAIHKFCRVRVCGHVVGSLAESLGRYGNMFHHCFFHEFLCPNWYPIGPLEVRLWHSIQDSSGFSTQSRSVKA